MGIDQKDLVKVAEGNTAEVYLSGEDKIVKLFRKAMPKGGIDREYQNARMAQSLLENVPRVYDMIQSGERYGIVYQRIIGKDMLNCMLSMKKSMKQNGIDLADYHLSIHKKVPQDRENQYQKIETVKEKLAREIAYQSPLKETEKQLILKKLDQLPDGDELCHFDFHPGNVMLVEDKPYIIDWMTMCVGDSNADVARTYLLLKYGEDAHASFLAANIIRFFQGWLCRSYLKAYRKRTGVSWDDIQQWLVPVAASRLCEWLSDSEKKKLLNLIRKQLERE